MAITFTSANTFNLSAQANADSGTTLNDKSWVRYARVSFNAAVSGVASQAALLVGVVDPGIDQVGIFNQSILITSTTAAHTVCAQVGPRTLWGSKVNSVAFSVSQTSGGASLSLTNALIEYGYDAGFTYSAHTRGAGTGQSVGGLTFSWTTPGQVSAQDGTNASILITTGGSAGDSLHATQFGFSAAVGNNLGPFSITFVVSANKPSSMRDTGLNVYLINNGLPVSDNIHSIGEWKPKTTFGVTATQLPGFANMPVGTLVQQSTAAAQFWTTDTYNATALTPAVATDSTFGVLYSIIKDPTLSTCRANIDRILITLYLPEAPAMAVDSLEFGHEIRSVRLPAVPEIPSFETFTGEYDHEIRSAAITQIHPFGMNNSRSEYDHEISSVLLLFGHIDEPFSGEYDYEMGSPLVTPFRRSITPTRRTVIVVQGPRLIERVGASRTQETDTPHRVHEGPPAANTSQEQLQFWRGLK